MDYARIARVAIPVAAAAAGAAVAAPLVADAISNDSTPAPTPGPEPEVPAAAASAREGASAVSRSAGHAPAPAPEPEPAPEAATEEGSPARRTYVNPVLPGSAADPTVVRGDDGAFYAFTTEHGFAGFPVHRSTDLTNWEFVGDAFGGSGPAWVDKHRWAPDIKKTGDHYTLLYSGRGTDGQMRIGYATSTQPAGPFRDRGVLVDSGGSVGYAIDPYLAETPNGWKLYYGSTGGTSPADQTGISAVDVSITGDGTMSLRGPTKIVLSESGERELVEGAWMHERDGTWYLFYSDGRWDARGGSEDYAVKVARSSSPDGPFEKLGMPVLEQGGGYTGTGHPAIVTDDAGQDWILYHAWGERPGTGRMMMLDPITWHDGWPVVNQGRGPSTGELDAPVVHARDGAATLAD